MRMKAQQPEEADKKELIFINDKNMHLKVN
jgi:hypothetical protein